MKQVKQQRNMKNLCLLLALSAMGTLAMSAQAQQGAALSTEENLAAPTAPTDFSLPTSTFPTQEVPSLLPPTAEGERGQRRAAPRRSRPTYYRGKTPRLAGLVEMNVGANTGVTSTIGAQLFPFFYLGGGINVSYWNEAFNAPEDRADLSLVLHPRFEIPTRSIVTPFFDMMIGPTLTHEKTFYVSVSGGVHIRKLILGLTYSAIPTDYYDYDYACEPGCVVYSSPSFQGLSFSIGYKF